MLGAIVAASELLDSSLDVLTRNDQKEIIGLIHQAANKTIYVTQELLMLASVREQDVKAVPVDMGPIVMNLRNRLGDLIDGKPIEFIYPSEWPQVIGYGQWLEEVWVNYVSNAIKYGGDPPRVEIGVDLLPDGLVKYWVQDNGKGLSPNEAELLFSQFSRLEPQRVEGNGLGLSIVKRIIEKLKGTVGIESSGKAGQGSKFFFILPGVECPNLDKNNV
jgi:signal transduction histidine kinase